MADQQQHMPGGHYSGANPVPTVRKFMENLDKDKKERDKQIEEHKNANGQSSGVTAHKQNPMGIKGTQKEVTDPVTGRQVVIEDVKKEVIDSADNPQASHPRVPSSRELASDLSQLSVPNANLGKPTHVKTDSSQSNPEYKHNQDITAPPDPVEDNTTSDVPIHGEKTNILFHPTPSVSYEPYFEAIEKRTSGLCIGIAAAILVVGNIFGGRMLGLIPLAFCVSSGVWLWMKEVVRSGREVEWDSEKTRGETVRSPPIRYRRRYTDYLLGHGESAARISRVDEHSARNRLGFD